MNLKAYDVLIFDCDGVIFDTTRHKLEAFEQTLSGYSPKKVSIFLNYLADNFGRSRYQHFRFFLTDILCVEFDQVLFTNLLESYSEKSAAIYEYAELCDGVEEFLIKHSGTNKYVASGSDENELINAFFKRGISDHFISIHGSPISKKENVESICESYNRADILMIGDSKADYEAAISADIDFLFVEQYSVDGEVREMISHNSRCQKVKSFDDLL